MVDGREQRGHWLSLGTASCAPKRAGHDCARRDPPDQSPTEGKVRAWYDGSPADCPYAIEARRYITHMKDLLDQEESVETTNRPIGLLDGKLRPIVVQLLPNWCAKGERLGIFLDALYRH